MQQELQTPPISYEAFAALLRKSNRRIRFANDFPAAFLTRADADDPVYGRCEAPFFETVGPLLAGDTGFTLAPHGWKYRCNLPNKSDYDLVAGWVQAQRGRLFLRSLLSCCVALDFTYKADQPLPPSVRTEICEWRNRTKFSRNESAIAELTREITAAIGGMSHYRAARFVAAVPPLRRKPFHLPSRLAADVARTLDISNLTGNFSFSGKPASESKKLPLAGKWANLDEAGLVMRAENLPQGDESVILLDDTYQSGATMHHVAMRMRKAGVSGPILGLAVVKTWRDDHNQR